MTSSNITNAPATMRHLFITGNSGAGKSAPASELAQQLGRSHLDLDRFAFADQQGTRRPMLESVSALEAELAGESAVIEGCYTDLISALAATDDHLIWLDLPVEKCVAHAMSRAWEPLKWPSKEAQDAFLPHLIAFIRGYPENNMPTGRSAHGDLFNAFPGTRERRTSTWTLWSRPWARSEL